VVDRLLDLVARAAGMTSLIFTALGIILAGFYWLQLTLAFGTPSDVHAYWAANPNNLYPPAETTLHLDAYLYSPAFELVVGWGRHLSFEVFTAIWRALLLVVLVYLAGPFTILAIILMPGVASEINAGNIQLPMAAAIVLSFRRGQWWPGLWAFVLLTKITPGVALLWFAARRQWRALGVAFGVTGVIALVTFAIWPDRWLGWIGLLTDGGTPEPLAPYYLPFWPRVLAAVAIVLIGAWRGWRWPVVVGATLALPAFYILSPSMLVGVLPFVRQAMGRWVRQRLRAQANPATDGILAA
jgi:hypothetical protein